MKWGEPIILAVRKGWAKVCFRTLNDAPKPTDSPYERVVLQHGDIEYVLHQLGVDMGEAYKARSRALYNGGRPKRLVLPSPPGFTVFGLPAVFGPVDKPTCEVE